MIRLTARIKEEIETYYSNGGLNVPTADCYLFELCHNNKGKITFQGGFDWKDFPIDKTSTRCYDFKTKKFTVRKIK